MHGICIVGNVIWPSTKFYDLSYEAIRVFFSNFSEANLNALVFCYKV